MNDWIRSFGTGLYAQTRTRRGILGTIGRASAGLVAAGATLAGAGTAYAAPADPGVHQAPSRPVLLPRGQKVVTPQSCGSCSSTAEYVCSNCCAGNVCCGTNLYRQVCTDGGCRTYYAYWCG